MENLKVKLRNLRFKDYLELREAMLQAYSGGLQYEVWQEQAIKKLLKIFPEGQLCVLVNNRVVACALSIIIDYETFSDKHTFDEITGNESFNTHTPEGDVLYGIDVFVHPEYRGLRLGRRLYDARKELCENLNLKAIMAGGRIPNYQTFSEKLTPRQYIEKVKLREIYDATLTFQLANDFHVKKIIKNYLPSDTESKEYATLLEWNNIYYQPKEKLINAPRTEVRIGAVQWLMRQLNDFDALIEQVEYFIDSVSSYKADFICFPEFFNAPLMAEFNHLGEAKAIRELAKHTEPLLAKFIELAVSYNINIITGSMPYMDRNRLYNITYLCRRDGTYEEYRKIHPTPSEVSSWGMSGGSKIRAFDTDSGRIGILICYDVEFPELARLYAQQGVEILFVPFLTDTQNGYNRVRRCAQARAVENECYIVIAGCVGNLPKVHNMDIQFAQSAIFTPSDFMFPTDAIRAEATPNTEMTIIADVNLQSLKELHEHGSVRTLKDRRTDLYEVIYKRKTRTTE
jgi:predicted amidohydrolase/GNAT superfamily N-acetyltransferase